MVFDDRAHEPDELESDGPPLQGPLAVEHLESQDEPSRPPERRPEPLMLVPALLLLLITFGWIVTIGLFVHWALT